MKESPLTEYYKKFHLEMKKYSKNLSKKFKNNNPDEQNISWIKSEINSSNTIWHKPLISKEDRIKKQGYRSCIVWLTGLSGSGKSTIAYAVETKLFEQGKRTYILDGDNIRHGLNKDLSFTPEDRKENIRRIGEVTKLFVDAGIIIFTAFISPYEEDREAVRQLFKKGEFIEVYVKCPVEECERRDPKGWYKKAKTGKIQNYTGISAPYEVPENPELILETDKDNINKCVNKIINYLRNVNII